jgi:UDP-N-acetylmuramate: L-alanyl-gamma-D-glutamyl-meso-diaminopimelate ligase
MHIHILGICGTFMGGVAVLAKAAGHRVTGCDAGVYPPMSTQLEAQGIELMEGFDPEQVNLQPDLFVVGNVVSRGNPLMEEILNRGLPYQSGPQFLAEQILSRCRVLAVAGTHGKTTTASMAAWVLEEAGFNPGFLIGGVPANFGISARLPQFQQGVRPWFVIEADEYDTAFFDKRSKFVHYRPTTAVLNNLEFDHADIFPNVEAIQTQFHHLVRTVPQQGLLVVNGQDANLEKVLGLGCWTPISCFGGIGQPQAESTEAGTLKITRPGQPILEAPWKMLGQHNASNALAVIQAAAGMGIAEETALNALSRFAGVARRMEVRGVVNDITVYDDFAHHPTAIETTLAGLRKRCGNARILAVIEPRSNTMKMGVWAQSLAQSLSLADQVFCYSKDLGWDAKAALSPLQPAAILSEDINQLVASICQSARPQDQILVMSNGGFAGIHQKILDGLKGATS